MKNIPSITNLIGEYEVTVSASEKDGIVSVEFKSQIGEQWKLSDERIKLTMMHLLNVASVTIHAEIDRLWERGTKEEADRIAREFLREQDLEYK